MIREFPILRSLYEPVLWMGVERMVAIVFIMVAGILLAIAALFAKAWIESLMLVAAASIGFALLKRRNLKDGMFFRLLWHRRNIADSYPAFNLRRHRIRLSSSPQTHQTAATKREGT
jgi:type IV secretory pathway TrbD component